MNKNNTTSPLGSVVNALVRPTSQAPRGGRRRSDPNRQQQPRQSLPMLLPSRSQTARQPQAPRLRDRDQIGSVVRTRLTRAGVGDIRRLRVSWVIGYIYVGNGTVGLNNAVYFQDKAGNLCSGFIAGSQSGQVPCVGSDSLLGAAYVSDVSKHFARKKILRHWIHIDSLQPSTANNMMAVVAPSRGGGGTVKSVWSGATPVANTVENVSSMKGAFPIDSWESKTSDISGFIAGGSGSSQNEFEIQNTSSGTTIENTATDGEGLVPCCFAVAGNSTTATLAGTKVHQVVLEQELDLLDYVGGMAAAQPIS